MKNKSINRLNKFFDDKDYQLEVELGREFLEGDSNVFIILHKVDKQKTKVDDLYGETEEDGIVIEKSIKIPGFVNILNSDNQDLVNSSMTQKEPGNMEFSVYIKTLEELKINFDYGDYIEYIENDGVSRYYSVVDDGRVITDSELSYHGYKPFFRKIIASPTSNNEFKGI